MEKPQGKLLVQIQMIFAYYQNLSLYTEKIIQIYIARQQSSMHERLNESK